MTAPNRLYKFGKTSVLDITQRFKEEVHESLGWRAIPLGRDYTISPLWSMWVPRAKAVEAEKWFAQTYPKTFYCETSYNGISECRDWKPEDSYTFYSVLTKKFPRGKDYDLEIERLKRQGTLIETHVKIYYIMLTKKPNVDYD